MRLTCVELRGLEPLPPLLAKSAQTVQHGRWPADPGLAGPAKSGEIQVCWCQPWVSDGRVVLNVDDLDA
jgi:hypothetical protein